MLPDKKMQTLDAMRHEMLPPRIIVRPLHSCPVTVIAPMGGKGH